MDPCAVARRLRPGGDARHAREEDLLPAAVYSDLPYGNACFTVHSPVVRGIIDKTELQQRLTSIRARLEA
jgi:hypothetical protein